jgi:hypothetical protein
VSERYEIELQVADRDWRPLLPAERGQWLIGELHSLDDARDAALRASGTLRVVRTDGFVHTVVLSGGFVPRLGDGRYLRSGEMIP